MKTMADKIIHFNTHLSYTGKLPAGIRIMNPFAENPSVIPVMEAFYRKFYGETHQRRMIIGINPGRFGAALSGVPFTDSTRLADPCGISYPGFKSYEVSSVFVYDVIAAYGGPEAFYRDFYIGSMCPLGFTIQQPGGKEVNYNYYDSKALTAAVYGFMVESLRKQVEFGLNRDVAYVLGTGKNAAFVQQVNAAEGFFKKLIPLEHPRFVMQYKLKSKQEYIDKYLTAFDV